MSTYLEHSALHRPTAAPAQDGRRRRYSGPGDRSLLGAAWGELWKRTAAGRFERLPDPATHPECWFKII